MSRHCDCYYCQGCGAPEPPPPLSVYKFKLPPDSDLHAIIVVVARSVEHAREVAAAYAQSDEAKAANGGNPLWSRWFHEHKPTVYPVDRPAVVTWTEFSKGD